MDDVDVGAVLAAVPLFADTLGEAQLRRLTAKCRAVVVPAGGLLMTEGDFGDAMFAIVEGSVAVTFHDRHGDEHGVAELGPGDIVGEMALLTGARRNATVAATSDVVAVEIRKVALEEAFARAPELIERFAAVLAERREGLDRAVADAAAADDIIARIRRFFGRR